MTISHTPSNSQTPDSLVSQTKDILSTLELNNTKEWNTGLFYGAEREAPEFPQNTKSLYQELQTKNKHFQLISLSVFTKAMNTYKESFQQGKYPYALVFTKKKTATSYIKITVDWENKTVKYEDIDVSVHIQ